MGACAVGGWFVGASNIVTSYTKVEESTKNTKESTNDESIDTTNCIEEKTKVCSGVYEGEGAVTVDAQTGKYDMGKIKMTLNEDGTFELSKAYANGENFFTETGKYVIYENLIFLKTKPHTAGNEEEANKYNTTGYISVSDDCSTLSTGYGSLFMNSDFKLNRK